MKPMPERRTPTNPDPTSATPRPCPALREIIARATWDAVQDQADEIGMPFPKSLFDQLHADDQKRMLKSADAAIAVIEPLLEAIRRHIRSYEPGTLAGSELNVAHHLRELDGEIWTPWCEPGGQAANEAAQFAELVEMVEASGTHVVVPVLPTTKQRIAGMRALYPPNMDLADECYRVMLAARPRDISPTETK